MRLRRPGCGFLRGRIHLSPVPISGPFLLAHLGFVALHAVETAAVVIGRARG